MHDKHKIHSGLMMCFLVAISIPGVADDKIPVMRYAYIQNEGHGFLVVVGRETKFQKGMRGNRTKWNIEFLKDGIRVVTANGGKLLGIDSKTKQIVLFDKPGDTTTWQYKSAGSVPRPHDGDFKAILFMTVGDTELRLSADETGSVILGGKADILHVYIDGP